MNLFHPQLQLIAATLPAPPMVNQEVLLITSKTIPGEGICFVFLVVVQWLLCFSGYHASSGFLCSGHRSEMYQSVLPWASLLKQATFSS